MVRRRNISTPWKRNVSESARYTAGEGPFKRGVGAGRSAERGTSAAATGPRGAAGPHNPDNARLNSVHVLLRFLI